MTRLSLRGRLLAGGVGLATVGLLGMLALLPVLPAALRAPEPCAWRGPGERLMRTCELCVDGTWMVEALMPEAPTRRDTPTFPQVGVLVTDAFFQERIVTCELPGDYDGR